MLELKDEVRRVLMAVDGISDELIKFLQDLIRGRSTTGYEGISQGLVTDILRDLGLAVDQWEPSKNEFKSFEAFISQERDFSGRPNVVGRLRGSENGMALAFNGHVDVVPAGQEELWKHGPWEGKLDGGRVYGRGACDMKAGLAAVIFAVKALLDAGIDLKKDILVESVIGEESGGVGTLSTILRGYIPDAAIIAEPTNLELLVAQCGCLNFRLRVFGKAAHGASRYLGVSAVEKFQPFLNALLRLETKRKKARAHPLFASVENPVTLSIGTVHAGNWDSTVPEELVAEGRYGVWPGESLLHAKTEFEETIKQEASTDEWLRQHPPRVEWFGPQWESCEVPSDHWLSKLVSEAYSVLMGKPPTIAGEQGGTDMRLYTNIGKVPAVLFGPGDASEAHFRDESIAVDDVIKACKIYALSALEWNNSHAH